MRYFILVLALVGLLTGCDESGMAARTTQVPNEFIYTGWAVFTFASVGLWLFGNMNLWRALLNAARMAALSYVIVGPLSYVAYRDANDAIAMTAAGAIGLLVVTVAFWKDLYPKAPNTPR